jgi:hypothetical protein
MGGVWDFEIYIIERPGAQRRFVVNERANDVARSAPRNQSPGAPPPPPPELEGAPELEDDELEELLLLEDDELPLDEDEELDDEEDEELELLLEEEELEDDELELLEELEPVNSSAPMSLAKPVGRGSPSISVVTPASGVVPLFTTPAIAEVRCRSQAEGFTNQATSAEVLFVLVASVPLSLAMGLLARLLVIRTLPVS